MIQVWICDDNKKMALLISGFVTKALDIRHINYWLDTFFSGNEVLDLLIKENKVPDVLFLAIKMRRINGYVIAEHILNFHCRTLILFVSAYNSLLLDSMKYEPFGCISKSHINKEIAYYLDKVLVKLDRMKGNRVCENLYTGRLKISYEEILFIECLDKKILINMLDGNILTIRHSLKSIYAHAPQGKFIYASRSLLLNAKHIRGFDKNNVIVRGGIVILISRRLLANVKLNISGYGALKEMYGYNCKNDSKML